MYISNKPIQRVSQVYQEMRKADPAVKAKGADGSKDQVILSSEGRELQAIYQKLYAPEEISAKAQELKESVASGTYRVSGEDIAAAILKSSGRMV